MEGMDFGVAGSLVIMAFFYLGGLLKSIVALIILHYSSKFLAPKITRFFKFERDLKSSSLVTFVGYELSLLILIPIVIMILQISSGMGKLSAIFNLPNFYLLSLTLWDYETNFTNIRLKSIKNIIKRGIVFSCWTYLFYFLRESIHVLGLFSYLEYIFYSISPLYIIVLTFFYIKRNKITYTQ